MSLNLFKENESVLTTQKHCPCIEFVVNDPESRFPQRHGFHTGQLLHYTLEPNDGGKDISGHPRGSPEKLTLAFATADVVLTGSRLDWIADHLRDGTLLAVRTLPARYANLEPSRTHVTTITVTPLAKE